MEVIVSTTPAPSPFANLGPAHAVAYRPDAPDDEVEDAGRSLMKAYAGYNLPQQLSLTSIVEQTVRLQQAEKAGNRMLAKSLAMLYPDAAKQKAKTDPWVVRVGGNGRYVPKPGIPFKVLKSLRKRIEVATAADLLRTRQLLRFAEPSSKDDAVGFRLRHADPGHKLTDQETEFLQWLTKFLLYGGREFDPMARKRKRQEGLRTFFRKLVPDALDLDHVAVETIPLLNGVRGLDSFHVRDSSTFYLGNFGNEIVDDETFMYQLAYGQVEVPFSVEEVALFQRNLDTDLDSVGYGVSELESSVDTISNWVTAMAYTKGGLDDSAIPRGILAIAGQFSRQEREAFKAAWDAKVRGVQNAHGLPVLFGQAGQQAQAQFIQTGQQFTEMAFAKWMALQASIMGGIYGFDPVELGLESFSASNKGPLDGDNTDERIILSRNQGLAPFLADVEGFISDELLSRFSSWARFQFTGVSEEDRKARQEDQKRMSTINELRSGLGLPPHPLGWFGDLPADATLLGAEFQRLQQTLTYDEARQVWGGLKVFPSDMVGLTPLNPSLGASFQAAMQAAAADQGGGDGSDSGETPGADGNPFDDLKPGADDEEGQGEDGGTPPEGQDDQGQPEDQGDGHELPESELQARVRAAMGAMGPGAAKDEPGEE